MFKYAYPLSYNIFCTIRSRKHNNLWKKIDRLSLNFLYFFKIIFFIRRPLHISNCSCIFWFKQPRNHELPLTFFWIWSDSQVKILLFQNICLLYCHVSGKILADVKIRNFRNIRIRMLSSWAVTPPFLPFFLKDIFKTWNDFI